MLILSLLSLVKKLISNCITNKKQENKKIDTDTKEMENKKVTGNLSFLIRFIITL